MKRLFLIAFFTVVVAELTALIFSLPLLNLITKPLIVLTLIGYYFSSVNIRSSSFVFGLIFCWGGDVLLMFQPKSEWFFVLGLLSFLAGHIFYIVSYRKHKWSEAKGELLTTQKVRFLLPVILAGTGLIVVLFPTLGDLRIPVVVYGVVLMLMVINALFRYGYTTVSSFWLVFGGALLFQVSDSLLALNKFHSQIPFSALWVMLTYMGAQFMIVEGVVQHESR